MNILGLSAYYHDSAACLLKDGEIVAAAQEERFTRKKHDAGFPRNAANYCLHAGGIGAADVDYVVFYDKPFVKFERLLETYLAFAPRGFKSFSKSMPLWLKDKLFQKATIISELRETLSAEVDWKERLRFSEHHLSHAASAFYCSPFSEAAILTMDGVGEWTTTSQAIGRDNELTIHKEIHFPHSLGLLYSAFTYYIGFKVNSGEYKVMGLAPYGQPKYTGIIKDHLIDIKEDGSFALDMSYFDYCTGLTMTNDRFATLFGGPPRGPETLLTQRDMDLAASIQSVTEEVVVKLARGIAASTGQQNLCLAGGVALNCVANGRLMRERIFANIWIQPAAGDAGGALGAALGAYHIMLARPRKTPGHIDAMKGSYLGPEYSQPEIIAQLRRCGAVFTSHTSDEVIELTARALAKGSAIGWHNGRMEFGPRALGSRSILADPRSPSMQKILNLKVKYRESFRPFAPSVLREDVSNWFELDMDSPYMLFVADVVKGERNPMTSEEQALFGVDKLNIPRSSIPAVTHVDYSARVQTVHKETNPRYHQLIKRFKELTGCPVIVNTSFNVRGEPIVLSPEDAFRCFMGTDLNALVVGDCFLEKEENRSVGIFSESREAEIPLRFLNPSLRFDTDHERSLVSLRIEKVSTREVTAFYAEAPFPNYNEFETIYDLSRKTDASPFLRSLKKEIGLGKRIVEVGSGTCQLSLALAFNTNNDVVALDPTRESLLLGSKFARDNNVLNVTFINADIFDNPIVNNYFDLVWSSGVLHHTEDPRRAFKTIAKWAKPGGLVIIGLYNKYGRLRTVFRQLLYRALFRGTLAQRIVYLLDPYLRTNISNDKKRAWFRDQYTHPRESLHSLDDVLNWFSSEGVEYVGSIPSCTGKSFVGIDEMSLDTGTWMQRFIAQVSMLWSPLGGEGGLFIVIGRRRTLADSYSND